MAKDFDPVLVQIGNRIVKRREELHMTATDLSIQADVSANSLSFYESGQRAMGIDKMYRITQALRIPFSYLQPDEMSDCPEIPEDCRLLFEKLNSLPVKKKDMLLKMFQAQITAVE